MPARSSLSQYWQARIISGQNSLPFHQKRYGHTHQWLASSKLNAESLPYLYPQVFQIFEILPTAKKWFQLEILSPPLEIIPTIRWEKVAQSMCGVPDPPNRVILFPSAVSMSNICPKFRAVLMGISPKWLPGGRVGLVFPPGALHWWKVRKGGVKFGIRLPPRPLPARGTCTPRRPCLLGGSLPALSSAASRRSTGRCFPTTRTRPAFRSASATCNHIIHIIPEKTPSTPKTRHKKCDLKLRPQTKTDAGTGGHMGLALAARKVHALIEMG